MNLNEYQDKTLSTAIYKDVISKLSKPESKYLLNLAYSGLGLAGEAGEVADQIKKLIRDDGGISPERMRKIKLELGDVLWYTAAVARELGFTLNEIAEENLKKLEARYERGHGG